MKTTASTDTYGWKSFFLNCVSTGLLKMNKQQNYMQYSYERKEPGIKATLRTYSFVAYNHCMAK